MSALHVVLEAQQIDLDVLPDLTDMGRYSEARRELQAVLAEPAPPARA